MAAIGKQIPVDAAAPHLLVSDRYATIVNQDAVNSVFLGGAAVDTNGYELKPGKQVDFDAATGDKLYAICAATKTARVDVLAARRSYA